LDPASLSFNIGGTIVGIVVVIAVLKWRVGAMEKRQDKRDELIEKLFDRLETHEKEDAKEHRQFDVAITKVSQQQETTEVIADALLDLMKKLGHDTDRYRRRRNGNGSSRHPNNGD
jgi:hypothetical protein